MLKDLYIGIVQHKHLNQMIILHQSKKFQFIIIDLYISEFIIILINNQNIDYMNDLSTSYLDLDRENQTN